LIHRYVRLDPKEEYFDPAKPIYFHLHGYYSKREGIARYAKGKTERLLLTEKRITRIEKAKDADIFIWSAEAFDDSPDFFVAGADVSSPKQVSETNPQQNQYAWGRSEIVEYRTPAGQRLQGALYYPADYQPGRQYPMIVHIYERESDFLHRYSALSDNSFYSTAVFSNLGYFVLMPDIVFRPRDPGRSIVECVTAAVNAVIASKRPVDPKKIGLIGHSWGAYGTTFTNTQSTLFAAAVAGAPLTNLSSSYGEVYWNSGMPETGHAETGQERMEVPLYEDREAFIRNSATFHANRMNAPLLIGHGDKDGACDLHQSVEMYNVARRAGKQLVLLVYAGENHGLSSKPVRVDYQRRIQEWFGHYLKGEPAPSWITKGVPFLEREQELKRIKEAGKKPAAEPAPSTSN
jgi:dipeptidyl aminopeptidase/acylaminoacyl peptidase